MPVQDHHPDYDRVLPQWQRCRDAVAGSDAVKERGTLYLPRLSGQGIIRTDTGILVDEYEAYKARANWYNASARTVQGLLGALFRKPPRFDVPEVMRPHLDDITLMGESLEGFARRIARDLLTVGRVGLLVDIAQQESAQARPYWVLYGAEDVINWPTLLPGTQQWQGALVLQESVDQPGDDEFSHDQIMRYRVLQLDDQGFYVVRLLQETAKGSNQLTEETLAPVRRGDRLDEVPFVFVGPTSVTAMVEKPPLLDLIDLNFSHYRSSADLEEGRHKLAIPTFWAAGFPSTTVIRLGSNTAIVSEDPNARLGMTEFTGAGLGELRMALEEKQQMMAAIGARLLEIPKSGVESAEAIQLRTAGEQNFLMTLSNTLSQALTHALQYHALWLGIDPGSVSAEVNADFLESRLPYQERAQLMAEYQGGLISWETYYYNLERGEITRPGVTAEEELAQIDLERPLGGDEPMKEEDQRLARTLGRRPNGSSEAVFQARHLGI